MKRIAQSGNTHETRSRGDGALLGRPAPRRARLAPRLVVTSAAAVFAWLTAGAALAGPQGGQIVEGTGQISNPNGATTQIDQFTQQMRINWQSFDVAVNEMVQFVQPNASALAINNILDQNPSQILGAINANGRVFLINPNGVVFGKDSVVNVAGLLTSSLQLADGDFADGHFEFETPEQGAGAIVNQGRIEVSPGGFVTLLGGSVANEGLIVAEMGTVTLAAGASATLDFFGDGLMLFEVNGDVLENLSGAEDGVLNVGQIVADGGQVLLTASAADDVFNSVVNNDGIVSANRIANDGGVIRLVGGDGDKVLNSGTLDASGADAASSGGRVDVLGDRVGVVDNAVIDVSGDSGGGSIHVGGEFQGSGERNAAYSYVGDDVQLIADANVDGDGGTIVTWAEEGTWFYGSASARGGESGGDGGLVEISGRSFLEFDGAVDTRAANGATGTLLFDPATITVIDGANGPDDSELPIILDNPNNEGQDFTISEVQIETFLNSTTVRLDATGDITINDLSDNELGPADPLATGGGDLLINADTDADGAGTFSMNAGDTIRSAGGNVIITGAAVSAGDIDSSGLPGNPGGDVVLFADNGATSVGEIRAQGGGAGQDGGLVRLTGSGVTAGDIFATGGAGGVVEIISGGQVVLSDFVAARSVDVDASEVFLPFVEITTTGAAGITIGGTKRLVSDVLLDSSAGDGVVDLSGGGVFAGNESDSLTILAGSGEVSIESFSGASLGIFTTGLLNLSGDILVGSDVVLTGDKVLLTDIDIESALGDIDLLGGTITGPHTLSLTARDDDLNGAAVSIDAVSTDALLVQSNGVLNLEGDITTSGTAVGPNGEFGIGLDAEVIDIGANVALDSSGQDIGLFTDMLSTGGNSSIDAGAGNAVLAPATVTNTIEACAGASCVGGSDAQYDLDGLSVIAAGFAIGRPVQTGDITVRTIDLNGDFAALNSGAGAVRVDGDVTAGAITLDSGTGGIELLGALTASAGAISLADAVSLPGDTVLTASDGIALAAGATGPGQLSMDSGGGDVSIDGAVAVDSMTILAGSGEVSIGSFNGASLGIFTTGLLNLNGDILVASDVELTGDKVLLADIGIESALGDIDLLGGTIAGPHTLSLTARDDDQNGAVVSIGAVSTDALLVQSNGVLNLGGDISTLSTVVLEGEKNLLTDVGIDSGGGDVNLGAGAVTGAAALTVTSGGGNVTLDAVTAEALLVNDAGTLTLGGDVATSGTAVGPNGEFGIGLAAEVIDIGANVVLDSSGQDIGLFTDTLITGAGSSIDAGAGNAVLAPATVTNTIEVCAGASCVGGSDAQYDLDGLSVNAAGFAIGRAAQTGDITVRTIDLNGDFAALNSGAGAVRVDGDVTAGAITLDSGTGGIELLGALTASAGAISLDDAVSLPGDTVLTASDGIALAAGATGPGQLSMDSGGGDVSIGGDVAVGGLAIITAGAAVVVGDVVTVGDTTIDAGTIQSGGSITAENADLTARAGAVVLPASNVAGNLSVVALTEILDGGTQTVGGVAALTAGTDITLDENGSTFGSLALSATNATVVEADSTELALADLGGNLSIQSGGDITDSGVLTVAGVANFTAVGDILLDSAQSRFGALGLNGVDAFVAEADDTELVDVELAGDLSVVSAGDITDSAALNVGGLAALTATDAEILLDDAASTFGSLSLVGTNASVTEADATDLAAVDLSGVLTVVSGGDITDSGVLTVAGLAAFDAGAADISIDDGASSFGSVALAGNNALIVEADATELASAQLAGGLTIESAGAVTDSGALSVTGLAAFTSATEITLDEAGSTFGSVAVSGVDASITQADAVLLAGADLSGDLAVSAGGDILNSGALVVVGRASFNSAADIVLEQPGSEFGSLVLSADNARIVESGSVDLAAADITGSLDVVGGVGIADSGTLTVGGLATFAAGTEITLDEAGSEFGSLALSAENAAVVQSGNMSVAAALIGDTLSLTSGGRITQTGIIEAALLQTTSQTGTDLDLGNRIDALDATNLGSGDIEALADVATLSLDAENAGGDIRVENSGAMVLGVLNASGNIGVEANGAVLAGAEQSIRSTNAAVAVAGSPGDIGTTGSPIVFTNVSDQIALSYTGTATIVSNGTPVSITSGNPGGLNDLSARAAGAAQAALAALQEQDEDVDWAAYDPDISLWEVNNEGVELPEDQRLDEFGMLDRPLPLAGAVPEWQVLMYLYRLQYQ